jgi:uncharacterized protein
MIRSSFIHLTGVTKEIESYLWSRGILNWKDLHNNLNILREKLPPCFFEEELPWEIEMAEKAFIQKDIRYFWDRLPYADAWRIFGDFSEYFLGLDIETTGLDDPHKVTCICVSNGTDIHQFTRTKNLESFYDFWEGRENAILVTYNGFRFDLPFLKRSMKWVSPLPHMDLMHTLHKMGIKGGLKGSEQKLGIRRSPEVEGFTGNHAVQLWNSYVETDIEDYLNLLEKYNQEDTVNLIRILEIIYEKKKSQILPLQGNLPLGS